MKPGRKKSGQGQEGYVLLALMLAVTLILIALSVEAPRIAQQIKREREEELVHRGMDYATAIKRFAHKNGGRFPVSVEQLEDTNHVRFLRKRYKDPITGEDNWRLVRFGEAQVKIPTPPAGGLQATNPGLSGSGGGLGAGGQGAGGQGAGGLGAGGQGAGGQGAGGLGAGGQGAGGTGSLITSNIGNSTGQPVGGGQIIGVASVSKKQSIKEFNDKDHYNDWFFVYDLRLEQSGGTGVTVAEPRAGASGDSSKGGQGQQPGGTTAPTPPPNGTPAPTPSPVPN
jgi:type II secretory pathway pseudopilin PulG